VLVQLKRPRTVASGRGHGRNPQGGFDVSNHSSEPFVKVPLSVVRADITAAAFKLWCALAARTNRDGECWPGKQQIMVDTGLCKATVRRATDELVAAGLLVVTQRRKDSGHNYSNLYKVVDNSGGGSKNSPGGSNIDPGVGSNLYPELESLRTRYKRTSERPAHQQKNHPTDCPGGCDGTGWIETGLRTSAPCPHH
jgi:hypothetical protein